MVHILVSTYSSIEDFGATMQRMQPCTAQQDHEMTNLTNRANRMNTCQSVLAFVGGRVMPAKGQTVGACGLYLAYRRHADRFDICITKERFYRILERHGYRRRHGLYGGTYEDLTYA